MRLRSITLAGFKTFARQTEITFDPGITAIVGPNGSGKSNCVDAVRWVLGETQARDLRGKRMEEIVYAGGARRPRAAAAEVTIVVDNADHRLPVDYQEVAVRRRVDRSGRSDYFLGPTRVRRRDLQDLLAATGLTTDAYAIVDQRDIEGVIVSTPEQRRRLLEAAAQVGGVRARRAAAAAELEELARNLLRLEDVRAEIEPRLEVVRAQAEAAREAAAAARRLDLLRGSIAWEEWRDARDAVSRERAQLRAGERRLAAAQARVAETESSFRERRAELQAAQDRRIENQRRAAARRLRLSEAEGALAVAAERLRGESALAEAAAEETRALAARLESLAAAEAQARSDLVAAEAQLASVPAPPAPPHEEVGPTAGAEAGPDAGETARRAAEARAQAAAARARSELLATEVGRLGPLVREAEGKLAAARAEAAEKAAAAAAAATADARLQRARAEAGALASVRPEPEPGTRRVGDVILAQPGWEAALSAALGPLVDAFLVPSAGAAEAAAGAARDQVTLVFPAPGAAVVPGSLYERVSCPPEFDEVARRLLGTVVVDRDVSRDGRFRAPGLVRAGADARVAVATRLHHLREEVEALRAAAAGVETTEAEAAAAGAAVRELEAAAGRRPALDQAAAARAEAEAEARLLEASLPRLDAAAAAAAAAAAERERAALARAARMAEHRAECRRLELERARWRERIRDLRERIAQLGAESQATEGSRRARSARAEAAQRAAAEAEAALPGLRHEVAAARAEADAAEGDTPDEAAELAAMARRLVEAEEARVDARLAATTLEGGLRLLRRDVELGEARLEALRANMPEGLAPDELPGGRAREREMRALAARLEEIGPTNALAEAECAELEGRYETLRAQLEDIAAARRDLDELVTRLRAEEESRYEAVFGAVAAGFAEFFAELTAGGRATLRHAPGEEGPRDGVEILVQPPRKRLQNVTLLSSGERALTALALVLALQEVNPAPFTILDEVDAALDDANVVRFGEVLQRLGRTRQLLLITHNHQTMAAAAALYGVHLDESGCSHLVSVRLGEARGRPGAAASAARSA